MRVQLKGVYRNRKTLATGESRDYWTLRGVGAINPQPGDEAEPFRPGTPAFMRAYNALIEAPRVARVSGTFRSIIDAYEKSAAWAKLAPRTKIDYAAALRLIEAKFGDHPIEVIEDPKIRVRFLEWRDEMAKTAPRQADAKMSILRTLIEWGRDQGRIGINHALRPKKVYRADRSDRLWLEPDIEAMRAVAPPAIRLAFELGLATGQRKGDLLRLGWSSYVDDPDRLGRKRIQFRQGKRRRLVNMPVADSLQKVLDEARKGAKAATILTHNGKPWSINNKGQAIYFDHQWRKTVLKAELDGLHFHDLRGTACTLLAEAQATPSEIAAMLGWTVATVNRMLDVYQSMTAALSDSAVAKLEKRVK